MPQLIIGQNIVNYIGITVNWSQCHILRRALRALFSHTVTAFHCTFVQLDNWTIEHNYLPLWLFPLLYKTGDWKICNVEQRQKAKGNVWTNQGRMSVSRRASFAAGIAAVRRWVLQNPLLSVYLWSLILDLGSWISDLWSVISATSRSLILDLWSLLADLGSPTVLL